MVDIDKQLEPKPPVEPLPAPPVTSWPIGLAVAIADMETAVGRGGSYGTEEDICKEFGITLDTLSRLKSLKAFRTEVQEAIIALKNAHGTVRRKASLQLEQYIDTFIPRWVADPDFQHLKRWMR